MQVITYQWWDNQATHKVGHDWEFFCMPQIRTVNIVSHEVYTFQFQFAVVLMFRYETAFSEDRFIFVCTNDDVNVPLDVSVLVNRRVSTFDYILIN